MFGLGFILRVVIVCALFFTASYVLQKYISPGRHSNTSVSAPARPLVVDADSDNIVERTYAKLGQVKPSPPPPPQTFVAPPPQSDASPSSSASSGAVEGGDEVVDINVPVTIVDDDDDGGQAKKKNNIMDDVVNELVDEVTA